MTAYYKNQKIVDIREYRAGKTQQWALIKREGKDTIIPVPVKDIVIK